MKIEKGKIYELNPDKAYILILPTGIPQNMRERIADKLSEWETDNKNAIFFGDEFFDMAIIENADRIKEIKDEKS